MKKLFYLAIAIILAVLVTGCTNPPGVDLPGDAKYAFTIGASDINKRLASFSSWGPTDDMRTKPEVSAPGVSIIAPRASGTSMGTPVNVYYTSASGTSMATPQVAGAAALLIQASLAQGYSHTPSGIKAALMNSAVPMVDASGKPYNEYGQGKGLINVSAAFNLLSSTQLTAVTPSKFNTSNPNASFKIVLINDQPIASVSASSSSTWITVSPASATSIQANNVTIFNVTLSASSSPLEGSVTVSGTGFSYVIPIRIVTLLDSYEPDDTTAQAKWIQNGETQTHNFNPAGDIDWMKFNATQAATYNIYTSNLGSAADTVMYLYNAAGTQLSYNDDSGGTLASKILWTAPSSGIYYIKVIDYGNNAFGPNTNYDITLLALQDYENSYLFEDAEFGINNWNATGLWHISQHRSYSPTHAWYYGQEGTWNYNTGARTFGNLTSPTIDLTGASAAMLSFWRWEQTEGGSTWDRREVYVSTSASGYTNWTKLYASAGNIQSQWYKEYVPLTSYADKVIKVQFRFDTIDATLNNYEGWHVDNINITGPSPTVPPTPVENPIVSIGSVYASPGSTATTQVTLQNMTDFGAASINLTYNPGVVQVTSASLGFSGSGGALTYNIDNTIGKARFLITTTAMPGPNAPLTLLNIQMQAAGSTGQSSPLDLTVDTLAHSLGSTVTPTVNDGSFTIPIGAVSINNASAPVNGTTTSQITLAGINDFGTATIDLVYNKNVVQVTGASLGFSGYGGALTPNINNAMGKARFLITTTAIPGPNSPLTLVNVNLQAVGSANQTSSLDLSVATLAYTNGTTVIPAVYDGVFSIITAIPGDVTGNGVVDAVDSMFLAQYVAGTRATLPNPVAGDVAQPCGTIDAIDSMFVAQYVAGTRPSLQLCS